MDSIQVISGVLFINRCRIFGRLGANPGLHLFSQGVDSLCRYHFLCGHYPCVNRNQKWFFVTLGDSEKYCYLAI